VKVGWYTHHVVRDEKSPENGSVGLFTGAFAGGAEMSDYEYIKKAPKGVEVQIVTADNFQSPAEFDLAVVTGTESFTDAQLMALGKSSPFVFVHHLQTPRNSLKYLIDNARVFVTHTPAHMKRELAWTNPKKTAQVLSAFDVDEIKPGKKENFALWAGRNHPLKGELAAFNWALKMEIPFIPLTNKPRREVLKAMGMAEYFVHLPLAFESEGRAVMEAVLSGCKVVANENVGITSIQDWDDPIALRNMIQKAGDTFWRLVQM
jgi:hypothetical protein